jgi:hypothetical protein
MVNIVINVIIDENIHILDSEKDKSIDLWIIFVIL